MAPNSNDEAAPPHESGAPANEQFDHEGPGEFEGGDLFSRGNFGSGSRFFQGTRDMDSDSRDRRFVMDDRDRQGNVIEFEGMSRMQGAGYFPQGDSQFRDGHRRDGYHGSGSMDRFDSGPFGRYGYSRDYGYQRRDRFDNSPYRGNYGDDRDMHGYRSYRRDYGGSYGYGGDHSRRSRYSDDGGNYGGYPGRSSMYGYSGDYRRPGSYGYGGRYGDYGRPNMYGFGGNYGDFSRAGAHGYGGSYGDYNRSNMYGYGGRYGDHGRTGAYGYGDQSQYGSYGYGGHHNRYGRDFSGYRGNFGGDYGYGSGRQNRDYSPYGYDQRGSFYDRDHMDSYGRYGQGYGSYGSRGYSDPSYYSKQGYGCGRYGYDRDYRGSDYRRSQYGYGPSQSSFSAYSPNEFSSFRQGQYGGRYGQQGVYRFNSYDGRSPYDQYHSDHDRFSHGYGSSRYGRDRFGDESYGYGSGNYGYGRQGYGGDRYGSGKQYGYGGDRYGSGGDRYGYGGDRYGSGGDRYGYGGDRYGSGGERYGSGRQYGYGDGQSNRGQYGGNYYNRPSYSDGRSRYSRRRFDYGGQQGYQHYGDQYESPPPFPPFSQSRSNYPTSFEFYDEDFLGKKRSIRAKEMAVKANFDLQRRKFYENVSDPSKRRDFRDSPHRRRFPHPVVDTLRIEFVDFLPKLNAKDHRTFPYELSQSGKLSPIFRRGQTFFMEITFQNRDFNPKRDFILLNFYLGSNPSVPKKTRIVLPVTLQKEFQKSSQQWDVRVHNQEPGRMTLQVQIPSTTPIGCWHCVVDTSFRQIRNTRISFRSSLNIYIIFNPFCPSDSTFMDNDELRTEYLMNDSGKIYIGGFKSVKGRPWVYGQFDDCVLPAACVLLEMSKLTHTEWGNPAKVVRAISSMIKAARSGNVDSYCYGKSSGVIVPRYEEGFRGGSSPHLWTGSVQIIEEFLKGGASPVKFGHCWVMAALMTTICRAIGLPARPITAFVAAFSTQDTMTVDKYINKYGDPLERGPGRDQTDSLWSFHTWCDVWMARPDLPSGNSGWQACDPSRATRDATESLSGACGPCSTTAIRKGDIGFQRDTDAFYSLLNSYVRFFYETEHSEWGFMPFMQFRFPVGRYILTKAPNRSDDENDADFEDVTELYKDLDRPESEKLFIYNAFRGRDRDTPENDYYANSSSYGPCPMLKEGEEFDVNFDFQEPVRVPLGEPVTVTLQITNNTDVIRSIQGNISCKSIFYTGVLGPHIKRITGQFTLEAKQGETLTLRMDPIEYQEKLTDMSFMKITVTGFVRETLQSFVEEFDFRFDKPKLIIEMPEECEEGKDCPFQLSFVNPLGLTLTECFVTFEMNGAVRPKTIQIEREVEPREVFQMENSFVPRRQGLRHLVACFSSKQLSDINGMRKIFVKE